MTGPSRRRARVQLAAASVLVGLVTAILPMLASGAPLRAQLLLGGLGIAALLGGVLGWAPGFTAAAIALGTDYSLRLVSRHRLHSLDGLAVVVAVGLFATVELGLRSLDARTIARPEPRVRHAAIGLLAAMIVGAAAAAFIVLAVGSRALPAPTAGFALGLAAVTAVIGSAQLLRRRMTRPEPAPPR